MLEKEINDRRTKGKWNTVAKTYYDKKLRRIITLLFDRERIKGIRMDWVFIKGVAKL